MKFDNDISRRSFLTSTAGLGLAGALGLAGCSSDDSDSGSGSSSTEAEADTAAVETTDDGKIIISFWHSMSSTNEEALNVIVDGYNEQSDTYEVQAEYEGEYSESSGKFYSMENGDGAPAIIQIGEENAQSMIDSGLIADVSALIEEHDFDDSDLLEQAVNFYTVDGVLNAMPFNCSAPVVYYNAAAFEEAGITEFPTTFEGITEALETVAADTSYTTPMGFYSYGYNLLQMVTNLGSYTVNNENGREGRATEVAYQDKMTVIFNWYDDLVEKGLGVNYGTDGSSCVSGFAQQDCIMFIQTSAAAAYVMSACDFEVGMAALPCEEGEEPAGVYAGGGALCIANNLSSDVAAGVMDFCQYATSDEVQAVWASSTGYYPISNSAYETETMAATYETYPQLEVSAEQLRNSEVNNVTAGPLCSQLPQLYDDLESALESVFNGGDVDSAIETAMESSNAAIESANEGVEE